MKTRLCHLEVTRQSLSLHQKGEVVATVIRVVHFSDFNGVISKEIVNDEGKFVEAGEEAEDLSVVVEELLLALDSATAKRFLHVLLEAGISEFLFWDLFISKAVSRN